MILFAWNRLHLWRRRCEDDNDDEDVRAMTTTISTTRCSNPREFCHGSVRIFFYSANNLDKEEDEGGEIGWRNGKSWRKKMMRKGGGEERVGGCTNW